MSGPSAQYDTTQFLSESFQTSTLAHNDRPSKHRAVSTWHDPLDTSIFNQKTNIILIWLIDNKNE